jgi:tetratricopeptide (TPR) repeat protein
MQNLLQTIASEISEATALRKEGDGLRKDALEAEADGQALEADELRAEALKAFRQAIDQIRHAISSATSARAALPPGSPEASLVSSLVELHGASGGLLQRLGERDGALASYREGALLESTFKLPSTYNRLNAVKLELLNGTQTLAQVTPRIDEVAEHIQQSLKEDQALGDGGWIYADLGDCLALLGRPAEAERAYATFVAKAGVKLPERALDVLNEVAQALRRAGDADVHRVDLAIATLTNRLGAA